MTSEGPEVSDNEDAVIRWWASTIKVLLLSTNKFSVTIHRMIAASHVRADINFVHFPLRIRDQVVVAAG